MRKVLVLASLVLLLALATAQVTQQAPSTDYFLPVTTVGSNVSIARSKQIHAGSQSCA